MTGQYEFETIPFTGEMESDYEGEEGEVRYHGAARGGGRVFLRPRAHGLFRGARVAPRSRLLRGTRLFQNPRVFARSRFYHGPRFANAAFPTRGWFRRRRWPYSGSYYSGYPDAATYSSYSAGEPADSGPVDDASMPPSVSAPDGGDEKVRWVQSRLNDLLGLNLPVTGDLDAATRSAVRTFQKRVGLPVDGIVGPPTEQALAGATQPAQPDPSQPAAPPPQQAGNAPQDAGTAPAQSQEFEMEFGRGGRGWRRRQRGGGCNCYDQ